MRKLKSILVLFLVSIAVLISGCTNPQSSSMEEAKYVVEHLPDCEKVINYLCISSGISFDPTTQDPSLCGSDPKICDGRPIVVHEIIYKKKGPPGFCLVLLNDDKPPKVVAKIDIGDPPKK